MADRKPTIDELERDGVYGNDDGQVSTATAPSPSVEVQKGGGFVDKEAEHLISNSLDSLTPNNVKPVAASRPQTQRDESGRLRLANPPTNNRERSQEAVSDKNGAAQKKTTNSQNLPSALTQAGAIGKIQSRFDIPSSGSQAIKPSTPKTTTRQIEGKADEQIKTNEENVSVTSGLRKASGELDDLVKDPTLRNIQREIPGSLPKSSNQSIEQKGTPASKLEEKKSESSVNQITAKTAQEDEKSVRPRRRFRISTRAIPSIATGAAIAGGSSGTGGGFGGDDDQSQNLQERQRELLRKRNELLRKQYLKDLEKKREYQKKQEEKESEDGSENKSTETGLEATNTSSQQQPENLKDRVQNELKKVEDVKNKIEDYKKTAEKIQNYGKKFDNWMNRGGTPRTAGGGTGSPVQTPGPSIGAGAGNAVSGAAGGGGRTILGFAVSGGAYTFALIALIALLAVLIGVIAYMVSIIAATNDVVSRTSTQGNASAFLEVFTIEKQGQVFKKDGSEEKENVGGPNLILLTEGDAAGNEPGIKEIRLKYALKLYEIDIYNERYGATLNGQYVEIDDIKLNTTITIPSQFEKNGSLISIVHPDNVNYIYEFEGLNKDEYPNPIGITGNNSLQWSPAICNSRSSFSRLNINNRICSSRLSSLPLAGNDLETMLLDIKFTDPIPISEFRKALSSNRIAVSWDIALNGNLYSVSTRDLLGKIPTVQDSITKCIDLSAPSTAKLQIVDCANADNYSEAQEVASSAQRTIAGPNLGSGDIVGTTQFKCPIAKNTGEVIICTPNQGFSPSHQANDLNTYKNENGRLVKATGRSVVAPVSGKAKIINSPANQASCGKNIRVVGDNGDWYDLFHLDGITFNNPHLPTALLPGTNQSSTQGNGPDSGGWYTIKQGESLGVLFDPEPNNPNPDSRFFDGTNKLCWKGAHLHMEIWKNGTTRIDPEPLLREWCQQSNYSCR